jgi:hypothetical protein
MTRLAVDSAGFAQDFTPRNPLVDVKTNLPSSLLLAIVNGYVYGIFA